MSDTSDTLTLAADHLAALAQSRYPEDIFPKPTSTDYEQINELLSTHRGHKLDSVSADLYRRAYAACVRELREMSNDEEEGAKVAPLVAEWSEGNPNDGQHEYVETSWCDGSNRAWLRRAPAYRADPGRWEKCREGDYMAARFPHEQGGGNQ